ncbi:MAG: glycosyltransferase [Candidatus Baltobacteraceae bacterium]|jgi:glycosyltransferase involved in cell wall biosynthesis
MPPPSGSRPPAAARIAVVTPWFGPDLRGGAEQQSWQLASQLTARGHPVDVLTTCCAGFNENWASNGLRAGIERRGLLTIRRFRVQKRDWRAFERVNAILISLGSSDLRRGVSPVSDEDARLFYENNINSPGLCAYLEAEGRAYSHILFLPYLYGTTLSGLPLVADRAYLQPCLHDEAYAYLPCVAEVVHAAKGILLNSEGEYELALRLFGPGIAKKSIVVGEGIDVLGEPAAFSGQIGSFVPSRERYVLYLGRQDPAKNVPMLVRAFAEFRRRQPASNLRLVLAGERPVSYGDAEKGIVDLGPVNESEKATLLLHALSLAQPSRSESFSRVIYESWFFGRPVVVHSKCMPTATAVVRCGGGLTADSMPEWVDALERIDFSSRERLDRLGRLGRAYAEIVSSWPTVIGRYESLFKADGDPPPAGSGQAVRRAVQAIAWGAETTARPYANALAQALNRSGIETIELSTAAAAEHEGPVIWHQTTAAAAILPRDATTVIYHAANPLAAARTIPYQNGTRVAFERNLFASSPAALLELEKKGVNGARFLPICVDPRQWDETPDVPLISALQDGSQNLLYAGPIVSLECLNQLLIVFLNYLTLEREARLTILASGTIDEEVYAQIFDQLRRLELLDRVLVARELAPRQFQAIFRVADAFISLDESESLGLEILQAMWFDIPVIAYPTAAARRLAGNSGLLVYDKSDLLAIAALAQIVVTDTGVRATVIAAQRRARERFDESRVVEAILKSFEARREPPEPAQTEAVRRS